MSKRVVSVTMTQEFFDKIIVKGEGSNGIANNPKLRLKKEEVKRWFSVYYYATLSDAFADINQDSLGASSVSDEKEAVISVYKEKENTFACQIFKDIKDVEMSITANVSIDLDGHTLAIKDSETIVINGKCEISNGNISGLSNGEGTRENPYILFNIQSGSLALKNISLLVKDNNGGTVYGVSINEKCEGVITDSTIQVVSRTGLMSYCVNNLGICIIEDSILEAISNHCANAAGNDYGQTARAVFGDINSSTTFKNCYIYGAHSGATIKGDLYIDEGIYNGYSHGGFYLSNTGKTTRILNATIQECNLADGYIDDGIAGSNNAGIYIGGASNVSIYVDNCNFYGTKQPIVLRGSSGESNNTLYISNSRINLNYLNCGIRNDGSNQIRIGINNNFDNSDLKNDGNYELTDMDYSTI